jgi:hypothetical protein
VSKVSTRSRKNADLSILPGLVGLEIIIAVAVLVAALNSNYLIIAEGGGQLGLHIKQLVNKPHIILILEALHQSAKVMAKVARQIIRPTSVVSLLEDC